MGSRHRDPEDGWLAAFGALPVEVRSPYLGCSSAYIDKMPRFEPEFNVQLLICM